MASIQFRNSEIIADYHQPYYVAEINTSHFGDINLAKEMIEKAKDSGCNCVKFQSWSSESLYSETYYKENPIAKRFVKKFSFSEDDLSELIKHCNAIGISFSSTPYSNREVDFLANEKSVPFIKIASMELNNIPYLSYIAKTGIPIVLSTGMGDMDEIKTAIKVIENEGNKNICILHCVSIYPPDIKTIRLKNIIGLRNEFPSYPIGFSDHSTGVEVSTAAVALGACLIEKHFTLDKTRIGMDNQMAAEPEEMTKLVSHCNNVQIAMGDLERIVSSEELAQRQNMRRSVILNKNLSAGTKINLDDLDVKRPGTGFPPSKIRDLVGKVLVKDVLADTLLSEGDFS
ncbi:MAG: N-acetylneuraminate synthase family protein [Candidatus Margulisiibacteriota bacterium]